MRHNRLTISVRLRARQPVLQRSISSSTQDEDIYRAYCSGANGYLVKPSTQEAFIAMVRGFAQFWLDWNRSEFRRLAGP